MTKKWVLRGQALGVGAGSGASLQPVNPRWPGYAAAWCALIFAVWTFHWALGGRAGLGLVGEEALRLAEDRDTAFLIAGWISGALKVAGTVLALALVQPWGRRMFPRWMLLGAGWACSGLLIIYGAGTMTTMALVLAGRIRVPPGMDWRGFYGHLLLWDPWFLVWGLLLALATRALARQR